MLGRGRGTHLTLPAWMTAGDAGNATPTKPQDTPNQSQVSARQPEPQPPQATSGSSTLPAEWTEHLAPNGRKYYYNAQTQESSWTRPTAGGPAAVAPQHTREEISAAWKQYASDSGRKYYYNELTEESVWTRPPEYIEPVPQPATPPRATNATNHVINKNSAPVVTHPTSTSSTQFPNQTDSRSTSRSIPTTPTTAVVITSNQNATTNSKNDSQPNGTVLQATIANTPKQLEQPSTSSQNLERRSNPGEGNHVSPMESFYQLLRDHHVNSDWTWERAMKAIMNDPRYGALRTLREKKEAFEEFLSKRLTEERDEKRLKDKKARDDFIALLRETKEIEPAMSFRKVSQIISNDPRYTSLSSAEDRYKVFDEFMQNLIRDHKETSRAERRKKMAQLREKMEATVEISAETSWKQAQALLAGDDVFEQLDHDDRRTVFDSHIRQLQKKRIEKDYVSRDVDAANHRKHRDEFRQLLQEHVTQGTLTARTHWREFERLISEDSRFKNMVGQPGSKPRDLFSDARHDEKNKLHKDKKILKSLVKSDNMDVSAETRVENLQALLDRHKQSIASQHNLAIILKDMVEKRSKRRERSSKGSSRSKSHSRSRSREREEGGRRKRKAEFSDDEEHQKKHKTVETVKK